MTRVPVSETVLERLARVANTSLVQRLAFERAILRAIRAERAKQRAEVSRQRRRFGWQWYPGTTGAGG